MGKRSHAIDRVAVTSPTPAQFKQMYAQVETGQITKDLMQLFLKSTGKKRSCKSVAEFLKKLGFTESVYYGEIGSAWKAPLEQLDKVLFERGSDDIMGWDSDVLFIHKTKPCDSEDDLYPCFQLILATAKGDIFIPVGFSFAYNLDILLECTKLEIGKSSEKSEEVTLNISEGAGSEMRPILYDVGTQPFRFNWPEVKADLLHKLRASIVA